MHSKSIRPVSKLVAVALILLASMQLLSQATVQVPFVGCRSDGQVGPLAAPPNGTVQLATDPKTAERLAVYQAENGPAVLAPRGWACFGKYGSSGTVVSVAPADAGARDANSKYIVQAWLIDGDTSGRFTVADIIGRVFPAHRSFADEVLSEHLINGLTIPSGPFPGDHLTYRSDRVVEYASPANSKGMGTYYLMPNPHDIRGVTVLTPESDVRHLALRLPPEMNDLAFAIIELFEAGMRVPPGDVGAPPGANAKLAFSADGRRLFAIGTSAMTYDVSTGSVLNQTALQSGTETFSIAANGTTAILAERDSGEHIRLMFFDLASQKLEPVPSAWYDPQYEGANAALSADGTLFSVSSDSGSADMPMAVTVYDRSTGKMVARQISEYIAAGGAFGGGVTPDGQIEFDNNRVGRKVVELKTGRLIGRFSFTSVRSADGRWVIELPDRSWNESAARDVIIKDGRTGAAIGKLNLQVEEDDTYGSMRGAFCGTTGRFVVGRGQAVTVHTISSGAMIASLPVMSWQDKTADAKAPVEVACSSNGTHVAVLSGTRLTLHDVP